MVRENAADCSEPAPRRSKGWRLHIVLGVVTLGMWLLAIPVVFAWRRGERGWAAGLAVAAVVAFGAVDRTSGTPVTTFHKSTALYTANSGSDRDKDGIACEQP